MRVSTENCIFVGNGSIGPPPIPKKKETKSNTKQLVMSRMKKSLALVCALFIAGSVFAQTADELTAKYAQAAELYNQKNVAEAIPLLEEVIKGAPAAGEEAAETVKSAETLLVDCYFRQAIGNASAKNFDAAIASINQAETVAEKYKVESAMSKIDNMAGKIYNAAGAVAFNANDFAKAIEVASEGHQKFPNNTDISFVLANAYAKSGDMAKATTVYQEIMALESKHDKYVAPAKQAKTELAGYMLEAASTAAAANDLDAVIAATDAVFAFDPTNEIAHMMRLQTGINAKKYDAVIGFGEAAAAAQTNPDFKANAYFFLGAAYQNKDNKAKAIEMYKKVTSGPNVATAKAQIVELSK